MSLLSNERNSHSSIQNMFILLLLAVFAGMSTLLVALGARVYRNTVAAAGEHNHIRIISAMVRSAVWAEDGVSEITTEEYAGIPILTIRSVYDDEAYCKRLYAYDGFLWESFSSEEYLFQPGSGETVCSVDTFIPSITGNILSVTVDETDGRSGLILVSMKSKQI